MDDKDRPDPETVFSRKGSPALLTLDELLKLASDRGFPLTTFADLDGVLWITDGKRSAYPLPRLPGGRMPAPLVESLCRHFELPGVDFALDDPEERDQAAR